jgi:hypothetical protein
MLQVPTGLQRCLLLLLQQILQPLLRQFLQVLLVLYCLYRCSTEAATPGLSPAAHTQLICQPLQLLQQQAVALLLLPSQCLAARPCL